MKIIQHAIEPDMTGRAGLFVTGTDVGKTWVRQFLAAASPLLRPIVLAG